MCRDCPTFRTRARGVVHELVADLLIPVIVVVVPIAMLLMSGHMELQDLRALVSGAGD